MPPPAEPSQTPASPRDGWGRRLTRVGALAAFGAFGTHLAVGDDAGSRAHAHGRPHAEAETAAPSRHRIVELRGPRPSLRMRGDWEPPDELLLAFTEAWPDVLAQIVSASVDQVRVTLLADPGTTTQAEVEAWATAYHVALEDVGIVWLSRDTPWVRDYGPLQLLPASSPSGARDAEPVWLDADYNPSRAADDAVPSALALEYGVRVEPLPYLLQGGALVSNGAGLCVSTHQYLESKRIGEDDATLQDLARRLGCRAMALVEALEEEPTHHADMFVQFLAPDVAAVSAVDPTSDDEDAARMDDAAFAIEAAARRLRQPMRVVRVPMPYSGGDRYFTHVNGLRLGGDFLAPSYREVDPDVTRGALDLLSSAMPNVHVVDVPADRILPFSGALHCISLGLTLPHRAQSSAARRSRRE